MTHHQPWSSYQPAPLQVPPPRRRAWPYVLGALALVALVALCIGLVNGTTKGSASTPRAGAKAAGTAAATTAPAAAVTTAPAVKFGAEHLKLTVKVTSKECFGSAGCLVQWSIRLATKAGAAIPERCEITYDVTGLTDGPQVGTITLTADGQYVQDEYASGQTPRSSSKLAAKITDVECD